MEPLVSLSLLPWWLFKVRERRKLKLMRKHCRQTSLINYASARVLFGTLALQLLAAQAIMRNVIFLRIPRSS